MKYKISVIGGSGTGKTTLSKQLYVQFTECFHLVDYCMIKKIDKYLKEKED